MSTSFWGTQHDAALRSPPQYRVCFAICTSLTLWGLILKVYPRITRLIGYPPSSRPHWTVWYMSVTLSMITSLSQTIYWENVPETESGEDFPWIILPNLTLLLTLASFYPFRLLKWSPDGRNHFAACIGRIFFGGLASNRSHRFMDILLADALTSLAMVIAELYICILMVIPSITSKDVATHISSTTHIMLLLRIWPFLIRLRQCLTIRQFANAGKYAASILTVILFHALKETTPGHADTEKGEETYRLTAGKPLGDFSSWLMWLWIISAIGSSSFSWYWDLWQDWDMSVLKSTPLLLGLGIGITSIGRFIWVLNFYGWDQIHVYDLKDRAVFGLWMLEICRRAVWAVLRAKTEGARRDDGLQEKFSRTKEAEA